MPLLRHYIDFSQTNHMNDFVDLPGEILDLTGLTDEDINQFLDEENPEKKFDLNEYINGDYDY
jgi:hypothetical protein